MSMRDWARKLDEFLKLNERDILADAGRVSHELAEETAGREFEKYDAERRRREALESPTFDQEIEKIKRLGRPRKGRVG